jgi:hypothetical protein
VKCKFTITTGPRGLHLPWRLVFLKGFGRLKNWWSKPFAGEGTMKRRVCLALPLAVLGLALGTGPVLAAQPDPAALAAVWAQEDKYWETSGSGDFDSHLKLFDERFTGWRCSAGTPTTKPSIIPSTVGSGPPGIKREVILDQKAATGFGDFVVVYYRAKTIRTDVSGKAEIRTQDYTHTWAASPTGWRIIGGMCRVDDPALDKSK